jgi:hypothetical protein
MADLSYLFQGSAPPAVNSTTVSQNGLPDWYQEYLRGIAAQGVNIAGQNSTNPIPQADVAGFTQPQLDAFSAVRQNQGAWRPALQQAGDVLSGLPTQTNTLVGNAQNAVGAPAMTFPSNFSNYMSPYTMGVVNEIGRLGNQNFSENIMPQIQSSMIGSGQFGSTRNADILSRAGRDAQKAISGEQSAALQAGYGTAGTLFTQDANRVQQQGQLQSSAALQGAQIGANAGTSTAGALTTLGQNQSGLGLADAQALGAVGQQQQGQNQGVLDTAYTNQLNAQNYDWTQLNNLNSVVRGMQLPSTQTQVNNAPLAGSTYQASPLAQVGQVYGFMQGARK